MDLQEKLGRATAICREAGALGLDYFQRLDELKIEKKGHQDFVSRADREVEELIRRRLSETFPDDAVVGEEHAPTDGTSGFTWVIDPIDGTSNFISGLPLWCVVLAGVEEGRTVICVIYDPCHDHIYTAARGAGAKLNGEALSMGHGAPLSEGLTGIGYSNRVDPEGIVRLVETLGRDGAMFHRNGSGALSLAFVAAGRFLGYVEAHMNAWDCIAGQLLVVEAGGRVEEQDADEMIRKGGRVVAGNALVFDRLLEIAESCYGTTS